MEFILGGVNSNLNDSFAVVANEFMPLINSTLNENVPKNARKLFINAPNTNEFFAVSIKLWIMLHVCILIN